MTPDAQDHGLGRRHAPDPRDRAFPMRLVVPATTRVHRYWNPSGWWGDQGNQPQCVAYAWMHWLEDGPVTQPGRGPLFPPGDLYDEAQRADEWEGEGYAGTSVRAGAKVLQARGLVREYRWAETVADIVAALLEVGPIVVGTNWYESMFDPDADGRLHLTGSVVGGHAYLLNGVSTRTGLIRCKNSWGRGWGQYGHASIHRDDLDRLLHENGEACLAVEVRAGKPPVTP